MVNRLATLPVEIGRVPMGGRYPVRIQSMTNTPTKDIDATVAQTLRLIEGGADYVRITVPGMQEVESLRRIKQAVRAAGFDTPLIADVHFNPAIAEAAARIVEKVRINPGNYVDRRTAPSAHPDASYEEETERMHARLLPLIAVCREYGTALRIGANHGSLSARILDRYGDTPAGMAASVMEFLRIFEAEHFRNIVVSMKASNPRVMIASTRLLVQEMQQRGVVYPVHVGVTEAGAGEEGRIKSAVGIAALLAEGIGDTVRVSLTEDPVEELPAARAIVRYMQSAPEETHRFDASRPAPQDWEHTCFACTPHASPEGWNVISVPSSDQPASQAFIKASDPTGDRTPLLFHRRYDAGEQDICIKAACDFGPALSADLGDGIWMESGDPAITAEDIRRWSLALLQACRRRISQTEYISCPSCGRTQYDITETARRIRLCTGHLAGLKIGIMGCIVNGPGEMADADYGYVGEGKGLITLYKKQQIVRRHVPESEAVEALVDLIKENGDWIEST